MSIFKKNKYFDINPILKTDSLYNLICGERSNGKTYGVLKYALEKYLSNGEQCAYIRRYQTDMIASTLSTLYNNLLCNGEDINEIDRMTKGKWDNVYYDAGKFYLSRIENGKMKKDREPFCYAFAMNAQERYKSYSYPRVTTILVDEFMTVKSYLSEEFVLLMNLISTIVRSKDRAKIFMCANTVDTDCPYFEEMGIEDVTSFKPGDLKVYDYGDSGLRVALQMTDSTINGKDSDKYFAFNNPKLKMITDGDWAINICDRLPVNYNECRLLYRYYIVKTKTNIVCGEIMSYDNKIFTFFYPKTPHTFDPNKLDDNVLVFSPNGDNNLKMNFVTDFNSPNKLVAKIADVYSRFPKYYATNMIGNHVSNWIEKGY